MQFFENYFTVSCAAQPPRQQVCPFGGSALKVHKACKEHIYELLAGVLPSRRFTPDQFVSFFMTTYIKQPRKGMPSLTIDIESNPEAKKELSSLGLYASLNLYFSLERSKRVLWGKNKILKSLPKSKDPTKDLQEEKKHFHVLKESLRNLHSLLGTRGLSSEQKLRKQEALLKKKSTVLLDRSIEKFLSMSDSISKWLAHSYFIEVPAFPFRELCTMLEEFTRWHLYLRSLALLFQNPNLKFLSINKRLEHVFWEPCSKNLDMELTPEISGHFENVVFESEMFPCLRQKYEIFYSPAGVKLNAKIVAQKTLPKDHYMALQKMSRQKDLYGLWFKDKNFREARDRSDIQKLEIQQNPYQEMLDIALIGESFKNSCNIDFVGNHLFLSFQFPSKALLEKEDPFICQFFCGWGVMCRKHGVFLLCSSFTNVFCWWLAYLQKINPALVLNLKRSTYVRDILKELSPLVESGLFN